MYILTIKNLCNNIRYNLSMQKINYVFHVLANHFLDLINFFDIKIKNFLWKFVKNHNFNFYNSFTNKI